uniref:Major facilitator superfamily (MFS) profile domain-containing protein n=1 Tax=Ornithorhynchus anatinus TaxID=9258 RepID=A0A6I8NKX4_ORNAN
MGFSDLLDSLGGLGTFQMLQTALLLLPGCLFSCQNFLQNFSAAEPDHRCRLPSPDNRSGAGDLTGPGRPDRCLRYPRPQWQLLLPNASAEGLVTEGCLQGWVYERTVFLSTIVTEWDLVCAKKPLKSIAQSIYMTGLMVGSVVFGILSDRFGRKTMLFWSSMQSAAMGVCVAFIPSFVGYCLFRFLSGIALSGTFLTSICLAVEWTPTQKRTVVNSFATYTITVGQIVLSGWAYLIPDWRWLQFSTSVAFGIILLYSWWLPESGCWLVVHHRLAEAVKNLQKVAWINGRKEQGAKLTPEVVTSHFQEEIANTKSSPFISDLFRSPAIRKTTCCVMFAWFSSGFSFYGLALDLQKFGFSIYWVQIVFAAVDVPSKLLVAFGMVYLGRRITLISFLLLGGSMIIINMFVPSGEMILALLGKGGLSGSFACLYQYTLELFPTEIRQMGLSSGVFGARVGSLLAPLVFIIGNYVPILQPVMFGLAPVLAALSSCFLRETRNLPLPETIREIEERLVSLTCCSSG